MPYGVVLTEEEVHERVGTFWGEVGNLSQQAYLKVRVLAESDIHEKILEKYHFKLKEE